MNTMEKFAAGVLGTMVVLCFALVVVMICTAVHMNRPTVEEVRAQYAKKALQEKMRCYRSEYINGGAPFICNYIETQ